MSRTTTGPLGRPSLDFKMPRWHSIYCSRNKPTFSRRTCNFYVPNTRSIHDRHQEVSVDSEIKPTYEYETTQRKGDATTISLLQARIYEHKGTRHIPGSNHATCAFPLGSGSCGRFEVAGASDVLKSHVIGSHTRSDLVRPIYQKTEEFRSVTALFPGVLCV